MTHAHAPMAYLRVFGGVGAGTAEIYNIKVEIGTVATAWCDSVITPFNASTFIAAAAIQLAHIDRATINRLSALVAYLGNVELGAGGAIRQGKNTFDDLLAGLYLGAPTAGDPVLAMNSSSGKSILMRPSTEQFEASGWSLVNPTIDSPIISTPYSVAVPSIHRTNQVNTSTYVTYGTLSVTASNGVGPYDYFWTFSTENGDVIMTGDPGGASVVIKGRGSNVYNIAWVNVQVTDRGTGIVKQAGAGIQYQHGTGQIP